MDPNSIDQDTISSHREEDFRSIGNSSDEVYKTDEIRLPINLSMLPKVSIPEDFLRLPSSQPNNQLLGGRMRDKTSEKQPFSFSVILMRHPTVGLGMTIRDCHVFKNLTNDEDGLQIMVAVTNLNFEESPALIAGVCQWDVLLKVNDKLVNSVRQAAHLIKSALPDSNSRVNLTFVRGLRHCVSNTNIKQPGQLRKDTTKNAGIKGKIHPLLKILQSKKMIHAPYSSSEAMLRYSSMIIHFSAFERNLSYTRMPLCIRILHKFEDPEGHGMAYTIWIHDVSSGKEWYAPTRFYRDFADLRKHSIHLCPKIEKLSGIEISSKLFRWNNYETRNGHERTILLESFLRDVCRFLYTSDGKDPGIAEVALHLRSFLGCDEKVSKSSPSRSERIGSPSKPSLLQNHRSIQLYVYLIFNLPPFQFIVNSFIEDMKKRSDDIFNEVQLRKKTAEWLKKVSISEVKRVGQYLDQLTSLILEGCKSDLNSINAYVEGDSKSSNYLIDDAVRELAELEIYVPLRSTISKQLVNAFRHEDVETYYKIKQLRGRSQKFFKIKPEHISPSMWKSVSHIIKEGVGKTTLPCLKLQAIVASAREISRLYQIECRHRDIKKAHEQNNCNFCSDSTETIKSEETARLSADDFLPIWIFSVVRSDIDRPCALAALLTTLCDSTKQLGETGYYLASFEAAIAYIQEINLDEVDQSTP